VSQPAALDGIPRETWTIIPARRPLPPANRRFAVRVVPWYNYAAGCSALLHEKNNREQEARRAKKNSQAQAGCASRSGIVARLDRPSGNITGFV
jgi:hypothetical protein